MVVGITGGIGSGKSTVVNMFAEFDNIVPYFADIEAKKLMHSSLDIKENLVKEFSNEVYRNGVLNRAFLANIVFKDKQKLNILNSIVHPVVHKHFKDFLMENKSKLYVIYENAILFENGSDAMCDKIITINAPINVRLERVMKRDNNSKDAVLDRIKNQWTDSKKIMLSNYIINNVDLDKTRKQVKAIHKLLLK